MLDYKKDSGEST